MSSIIWWPIRPPLRRQSIRWRTSASQKILRRARMRRRWGCMLSPRWRKVLRDLWSNKTRTILVVLSIAVGVFAIGMVGGARVILIRDLTGTWMSVNPASASLSTEAFDDELVQVVRKMPGVSAAEALRTIAARVKVGPEEWKNM